MCDVVRTSNLDVARYALSAGQNVELGPGTYNLGTTGLQISNSGQILRGVGPDATVLSYTGSGNAVEVLKPSTFLQRVQVEQLTISGNGSNGSGSVGLYIKGCRFGSFQSIVVKKFGSATGVALEASSGSGTYYNYFRQVVSGGTDVGVDPNAIGFRVSTTDHPGQPVRINDNVFEVCAAQFNTAVGMTVNGTNTLHLYGFSMEKNANGSIGKGLVITNSTNLHIHGGYFEGHPEGDVELGASTFYSTILRPRLASTNRLIGVNVGATGDFYLTAESSAPAGPTQYGSNWIQKLYAGELMAGTVEFVRFSAATRFMYAKLSGDSQYRFQIWNDGAIEFGDGSAVPDTKLYRSGNNTLALGGNDDLQLNGSANAGRLRLGDSWLWVSSSGKLLIKNGPPAPTSDADGIVVGTQS